MIIICTQIDRFTTWWFEYEWKFPMIPRRQDGCCLKRQPLWCTDRPWSLSTYRYLGSFGLENKLEENDLLSMKVILICYYYQCCLNWNCNNSGLYCMNNHLYFQLLTQFSPCLHFFKTNSINSVINLTLI